MPRKSIEYQEIHSEIGGRIRQRRRAIGLTQSQVADALAVTFQQIQKYESGQCNISCGRLVQIAEILDVPPSELIVSPAKFPDLKGDAPLDADTGRLWANFSAIKSPAARRSILRYLVQMVDDGGSADLPPGAASSNADLAEWSHR